MEPKDDTPDEQVIVQLPTAELKPRTLIHQLLEDADNIDALFVVSIKNGELVPSWTNAPVSQLMLAARVLQKKADDALFHGTNTI